MYADSLKTERADRAIMSGSVLRARRLGERFFKTPRATAFYRWSTLIVGIGVNDAFGLISLVFVRPGIAQLG